MAIYMGIIVHTPRISGHQKAQPFGDPSACACYVASYNCIGEFLI
jgi:hypothetical protein